MNTATTLPSHGTPAGYRKGCRQSCCLRPETRRKKHAALIGGMTIDVTPVTNHIKHLLAGNASYLSIAEAANCGIDTIKRAVNGQHTTIRRATAARILAVTSAPETQIPIDPTGSIRRVRALMAAGYSSMEIQEASGANRKTIANLLSGTATGVWGTTADRIDAAYARLSGSAGSSARSRNRAAREGWPPPMAWNNIDDPDEVPSGWRRATERRNPFDLVEDADFITRTTGVTDKYLLAERLEVKVNTLEKARERVAARAKAGAA